MLDKAFEQTNFFEKRRLFKEQNIGNPIKKGIGLATFMHGAGFTGSAEARAIAVWNCWSVS